MNCFSTFQQLAHGGKSVYSFSRPLASLSASLDARSSTILNSVSTLRCQQFSPSTMSLWFTHSVR